MKLSLLQRLALFARYRYRTVFIGFGVLVVVSAFLISRLSFDTDMLSLLPKEDPAVRTYVETLQDFSGTRVPARREIPP